MRVKRGRRGCFWWLAAPAGLCALAVLASWLSNFGLPVQSPVLDRLTAQDKARLSEVTHLRSALGGAVWPGWEQASVSLVVYNEAYAFLVGYPPEAGAPPPGWVKVPRGVTYGGPWEVVPGELFEGQPYYRQPLPATGETPEAFTVLVGGQWAASFMTMPYAQIELVRGLQSQLPPGVRSVAPYRLLIRLLMGESEGYVAALLHESFHAFQGASARPRFDAAENVMALEPTYPWDSAQAEWQAELEALAGAALAPADEEAAVLAEQFLALRADRRAALGLSANLIEFERQREWLEGLAKYAELASGRLAAESESYAPLPIMAADPSFHHYRGRLAFWSQQLGEVRRTLAHEGEIRFYYTGLAQAAVLDRLLPGWKARAFEDGVWLEDLLRLALAPGS